MRAICPMRGCVTSLATLLMGFLFVAQAGARAPILLDGSCGDSEGTAETHRVGRAMLQQAFAGGMPWGGESLQEYVNRLGQNLARASGSRQTFTFYVLYNPQINAQAFPGGYVVVNSGAISFAESEAELAFVLSHEIAHINTCDWQTSPKKGNLFELLALIPAVALTGPVGIALAAGSGLVTPVARARFSRSAERRADRLAAQYLAQAGYDPRAAVEMLTRIELESDGEEGSRGLLATHPRTSDRWKQVEEFRSHLPSPEIVPHDEAEFRRMQKEVRDYDEVYAQAVHTRLPGKAPILPPLTHRSAEKTLP